MGIAQMVTHHSFTAPTRIRIAAGPSLYTARTLVYSRGVSSQTIYMYAYTLSTQSFQLESTGPIGFPHTTFKWLVQYTRRLCGLLCS